MQSHTLPNGVEVMSYDDTSDFRTVGFGLQQKRLTLGDEGDPSRPILILTHFPPNSQIPRHYHGDVFIDIVVAGTSTIEGETHGPGTVRVFPAKAMYGPVRTGPEGCTLLEFYVDQPGFQTTFDEDALTDEMKAEMARYRASLAAEQ